ncbi:hypothetical protein, partial [Hymenobacter coccineus]|uniref:hypothetical protein n=1 Tax=Hymenobacter coccineus TaxID=1908235 RepID=UPI001955C3CE
WASTTSDPTRFRSDVLLNVAPPHPGGRLRRGPTCCRWASTTSDPTRFRSDVLLNVAPPHPGGRLRRGPT